ncbi:MAG: hypothetical protein Q8K92_06330 [Leadbetterella sp.]|nr:hypothetical protein [Leadbetterella sp.]
MSYGFIDVFKRITSLLDANKRIVFIWILCIVICSFHYFSVVRVNKSESKFLLNTSNDFLNLVSSFTTFSVVINSSLTLISGIISEFIGVKKLFVNATTLDFYTILASSFFPIIWSITQMVDILNDSLKSNIQTKTPIVEEKEKD